MGPSRKRVKPNPPSIKLDTPKQEGEIVPCPAPSTSLVPHSDNVGETGEDVVGTKMAPGGNTNTADKPPSSWYKTWPRKSAASTQVARETILADKPTNSTPTTDLTCFEPKKPPGTSAGRPPSMYVGKSKGTLDVTMGGTTDEDKDISTEVSANQSATDTRDATPAKSTGMEHGETQPNKQLFTEDGAPPRPGTASGWLGGWLGKPVTQALPAQELTLDSSKSSVPDLTEQQGLETERGVTQDATPAAIGDARSMDTPSKPATSWFGLWSTILPSNSVDESKEQVPVKQRDNTEDVVMRDTPAQKPAAGSSWAFWSNETSMKSASESKDSSELGQLAVTGDSSQNHPQPAKTTSPKETKDSSKTVTEAAKAKIQKDQKDSTKRGRPQSTEVDVSTAKAAQLEPPGKKVTSSESPAPTKTGPPNLLVPSVRSTYRLVENPSILQQIARLLLHGQQQPVKHVFLAKDPPKIKKALAIGIHGLFPAPLLRTVIGQPTGTSIRFANHAATAIRRWADKHKCSDCEIEKVALEGEGKIAERVDNLWKLLLNWIDHVRKADFILIACHSQGVPVAVMLVAKLIEFGVISTRKIGICAMAGVSLGPFMDYKSRLFSGSAGELFEFADPESTVSKRYEDALRIVLNYGAKVTYCGSIDDQLISLESAVFSTASHPNIYRLVFVDGRIHAPDFLSHLVGFALKLRNLGVSDHGLIRELSAPLAGSLYTGEGHSRLYDEEKVYDLAVEFALETTTVSGIPLQVMKYEVPTNANPYILPWIMRGLLEEDFVKTELDSETTELLRQFDDWKPATKVLKDVKYRLEAVRSKL